MQCMSFMLYIEYMKKELYIALLRMSMGLIFLWAFLDKLFGLGFATTSDKSWLMGASPTYGFLKFGTSGPFKPFFETLAGNPLVDLLFMLGLLGVGTALVLGIARKLMTLSGSLLLLLLYLAAFPPKNNPIVDEHIIYIFVLQVLFHLHAGEVWGLGKWWNNTSIVKKFPFLK